MSGNRSLLNNSYFRKIFVAMRLKCAREVLSQVYPGNGDVYCNATSTIFGCWNYTLAGSTASMPCPPIPGLHAQGEYAFKKCSDNATWERDDYTDCRSHMEQIKQNPHQGHEHAYIFVGGYSISIALLLISLFIFFRFSQLRCDRITIHKNLFISYIFTGVTWILYTMLVAIDADVIFENPIWCQFLHGMAHYCVVSNFIWMFCEGFFLHTIMVKPFTSSKWVIVTCFIMGWGLPVILVSVYSGFRATKDGSNVKCWIPEDPLQWIMYAPVVASFVANVIFLCNILRLIIFKLRQVPEAVQTKRAARATLILIPLLGLHFILIPVRPAKGSQFEDAYHYISALMISLQGAFVATLYCFLNSEVISVLKRKWYQHKVMFSGKRSRTSSTIAATTYTFVDHVSQVQTSIT